MKAQGFAVVTLLVCGCGTGETIDTVGYVPVSAVIVRAESALAGRACGEADDAIFKYRVTGVAPQDIKDQQAVYDCFADAYITPAATTETELRVEVSLQGFSKAQFAAGSPTALVERVCAGVKKANLQTVLVCTDRK